MENKFKKYRHLTLLITLLILQLLFQTLQRLGDTRFHPKNLQLLPLLSLLIKWYINSNFCLIFKRTCLKQRNATFTPLNIINFFIAYE